jgi:hypothetical protein
MAQRRGTWAIALAAVMAGSVVAQDLRGAFDATPETQKSRLAGKPAVDLLPGKRTGLAYPLRYPNIVPGTVKVWVAGREMREGDEFRVDHAAGLLYMLAPVRPSDSIRVLYRHDPDAKETDKGGVSLPVFTLNFGQAGSMRMLLGATGVNRMADGTLMQSHSGGVQNSFAFGRSTIDGFFLVSSQAAPQVEADSASPDFSQPKAGIEGTDSLIRQRLKADVGSGFALTADFQDVGEKFDGFGMLASSGMEQGEIDQLRKERGITRFGLGFAGQATNGLSLTNNFRTIDDGTGRITWQQYGLKVGGLELNYDARSVDRTFSRFKDLAEGERAQLQKERGIDRLAFGAGFNFGSGALKFSQSEITSDGEGIFQRSLRIDTPWLRGSIGRQEVTNGFNRAKDLAEAQREQWDKERGFVRNSLSLAIPKGEQSSWLSFDQNSIHYGDAARFDARSLGFDLGSVRAQYWERESSDSFNRLNDMSPQERKAYVQQTLSMYEGAKEHNEDVNWFGKEAGLRRSFLRVDAGLGSLSASLRNIGIHDDQAGIEQQELLLRHGAWSLEYRNLHIGQNFDRTFDLLDAERKYYGNQRGFSRQDIGVNGVIGNGKLGFSMLNVDAGGEGLSRFRVSYEAPKINVSGGMRSVSEGFDRVRDLNDPERDFLSQLVGYNQKDLRYDISLVPRLRLSGMLYDSGNGDERLRRSRNEHAISWQLDARTALTYRVSGHHFQGLSGDLFVNNLSAIEGERDFGRLGKLSVQSESESFKGSDNNRPDRETLGVRYENQLTKNFKVSTEQFRTRYSDGGYEDVQAYGASWQLTPRFGVTLKDVHVDRDAAKNTQRFLDYGVTYDFGNGIKLGYTFHRELNSQGGGKRNYRYEMSEGEFGGFKGGGQYDEKRIDDQRTTALGKFHISNTKPFQLGFLRDVQLAFGYDSQTDRALWQKERKLASLGATAFGTRFEIAYDQIMLPDQRRAYDRSYKWTLDPTGKAPLQASLLYKSRALPGGDSLIIRDYDISYRMNDGIKLSLTTDTFPEKEKRDAPFGSVIQPTRARTYALEWAMNPSMGLKVAYSELMDLAKKDLSRRSMAEVVLFAASGSPVRLAYGMDQDDRGGSRKTRHLYQLAFDQKPGPNQTLSFVIGNIAWEDGRPENEKLWNRWDVRVDYQLRF